MTAAVLVLTILLGGTVCIAAWLWVELDTARRELRETERQLEGLRDDLWRRDRLGVRPKGIG